MTKKEASPEQKIIKLVSSLLQIEKKEIAFNSHFFDDLNADQMALNDLFLAVEEEFAIKIPKEDLEQIQKVSDLIKIVKEKSDDFL